MPHLVPVAYQLHDEVFKKALGKVGTGKNFLRRKIIVESPLRLMPVMSEPIPLAPRLDIHVQPVVKDHGSIGVVCNAVVAWGASECGFLG